MRIRAEATMGKENSPQSRRRGGAEALRAHIMLHQEWLHASRLLCWATSLHLSRPCTATETLFCLYIARIQPHLPPFQK